jgi:hypothetical protein
MVEVAENEFYITRWECPTFPLDGCRFRVIEDEWDHSGPKPIRTIKQIEVITDKPDEQQAPHYVARRSGGVL